MARKKSNYHFSNVMGHLLESALGGGCGPPKGRNGETMRALFAPLAFLPFPLAFWPFALLTGLGEGLVVALRIA